MQKGDYSLLYFSKMKHTLYLLLFLCIKSIAFAQPIIVNGFGLPGPPGPGPACGDPYEFVQNSIGSPQVSGNCITITDGSPANASAGVWVCPNFALDLTNDFNLTFTANFGTNANSGDGIVFVMDGDDNLELTGVGGDLGYASISPSIGVEFDTWPDADIDCHHAEINQNGISSNLSAPVPLKSCCGSVVDGLSHSICISWDVSSQTLVAIFDGNVVGTYTGDITSILGTATPIWGFTAGCGAGGGQIQTICNVVMDNDASTSAGCSACWPNSASNPSITNFSV